MRLTCLGEVRRSEAYLVPERIACRRHVNTHCQIQKQSVSA